MLKLLMHVGLILFASRNSPSDYTNKNLLCMFYRSVLLPLLPLAHPDTQHKS